MKIIGIGLLVIAIIVGAFFFFVANNAGALVETAIEEAAPVHLGVTIDIEEIDLSFSQGIAEVRGVVVGNPVGYDDGYAVKIDQTLVELDPADISGDVIRIKRIAIDGADIAVVAKGLRDNNLKAIADRAAGTDDPVNDAPVVEDAGDDIRVIVSQLDFTNATASLATSLTGKTSIAIPDIHLTDVGESTNGASMAEVASQLLRPIVSAVSRALVDAESVDAIKGKLDQVRDNLSLDQLKDKVDENLKKIDKEDITNALERLIDRD